MSNRKFAKTVQEFFREVRKLYRTTSRKLVDGLLRMAFVSQRRGDALAGFVLPAAMLLILVVSLTVGAMTLRAFDRNTQVIANNQQKVIYNAATPAIDRARSKLEYLFDANKDVRYPGGVPSESFLLGMLYNDGRTLGTLKVNPLNVTADDAGNTDPYTLPDEFVNNPGNKGRLDLDNDGKTDNAWSYRADTNGDGTADATVVYSIMFKTPVSDSKTTPGGLSAPAKLIKLSNTLKAKDLIVRGGPLSSDSKLKNCSNTASSGGSFTEEAWFIDAGDSSTLRKNFQVDAMVIPDNPKAAAVTLEFQQDRQLKQANKWGAWFRSDLEIFPGPQFNWNGAMHTEGSLILGGSSFNAYLVSATNSCLFEKDSSEISVTNITGDTGTFNGQIMAGKVADNSSGGSTRVDWQNGQNFATANVGNGSDATGGAPPPSLIQIDPYTIFTSDGYRSVGADATNGGSNDWGGFKGNTASNRVLNVKADMPYVDDLYRADNLYGPKPRYKKDQLVKEVGLEIPASEPSLISSNTTKETTANVGLDGYWERRAQVEGLRVLVGQRLELGNIGGWETPRDSDSNSYVDKAADREGDPLYPPTVKPYPVAALTNLQQQRRSLRDNLSAVQSAAVYHAAVGDDNNYPVACIASTVHPGTVSTLRQGINFLPTSFKNQNSATDTLLLTDFFTGRGTNGWEFQPPGGNVGGFAAQLAAGQPLRIALENLANFAGDPDGAFPPTKQDDKIHPYPTLAMWGNYSNLRRALKNLDTKGYGALSVADQTYLQTAACTVGMLAYNIDQVQKFDPTNAANDKRWNGVPKDVMSDLADRILQLMNGDVSDGEVLPKAKLATYLYNSATPQTNYASGPINKAKYDPRDYYEVPPESYIAALKQQDIVDGKDYLNDPVIRMAEVIMLSHQVRRDRTFGFRPSPAFGEYLVPGSNGVNDNKFAGLKVMLFPAACDPDQFALSSTTTFGAGTYTKGGANILVDAKYTSFNPTGMNPFVPPYTPATLPGAVSGQPLVNARLALSRLCGTISIPRNADGTYAYDPTVDYDPTNPTKSGSAKPVVRPKFPTLYYVFPEVEHDWQGELIADARTPKFADTPADYDHRQPGNAALVTQIGTNDATAASLGLDKYDVEPYVADPNGAANVSKTYRFKPVITLASAASARQAAIPTLIGATVAAADPFVNKDLAGPNLTAVFLSPNGSLVDPVSGLKYLPFSRRPYFDKTTYLPVADQPVSLPTALQQIALQPRGVDEAQGLVRPTVVNPINNAGAWQLPNSVSSYGGTRKTDATNTSPNLIQIPKQGVTVANLPVANLPPTNALYDTPLAVPFLDRAMFNGRQLLSERVMDIDVGMLRSTRPNGQSDKTLFSPNEPWLPISGIAYAFREDAIREDAILRPASAADATLTDGTHAILTNGTAMDLRNPAAPKDPPLNPGNAKGNGKKISVKAIDHLPDPDRRTHGFRLRNGAQIKRNPAVITTAVKNTDNVRGMSFFTDNPLYILGDFNLHQLGTGDTDTRGATLEEFTQQIFPDGGTALYDNAKFYNRTTKQANFTDIDNDRWRPTELFADSISILSSNFCDGSISDTFVNPQSALKATPDFDGALPVPDSVNQNVYGDTAYGLFNPACTGNDRTSFSNQNRPNQSAGTNALADGAEWAREMGSGYPGITVPGAAQPAGTIPPNNGYFSFVSSKDPAVAKPWSDFTSPVKISRSGEPLVIDRPLNDKDGITTTGKWIDTDVRHQDPRPIAYSAGGRNLAYLNPGSSKYSDSSDEMRVNAIVVSGISPSRPSQSFGGLHNFPRFLESWSNRRLIFAGSFLQLNFSNYATGPFEQQGLEYGAPALGGEPINYYVPPNRLWGYDVGLQFAPAGPAAARFVTASTVRSEFYYEPPRDDAYIYTLCKAAKLATGAVPGAPGLNCPGPV
jgi:hypothetical protein